jgi:GT2 family glycosyltransferase
LTQTTYSAVIVTRNRPDALALSLPLLLEQSRPPAAIYVIDSSDDPSENIALTTGLAARTDIPLEHHTSPSGMTVQRNIGLGFVKTDVVFFPDDDSLVHPGSLEAMMRVYDLDTDHRVGGVCSSEAKQAPEGVLPEDPAQSYQMTRADRLKARIARTRFAIEKRSFRDPFYLAAERAYSAQGISPDVRGPSWTPKADDAIYVPWMTGFRMSFRTEVIRQRGFDENLGRYALFEDTDASFGILESHLLIGARTAQISHPKAPARRANGRAMGAMQILNRAYVVARTGQTDRKMRALHRRYSLYKIMQYTAAATSTFGRDRVAGAWAAHRLSRQIFDASPDMLTQTYVDARTRCFETES